MASTVWTVPLTPIARGVIGFKARIVVLNVTKALFCPKIRLPVLIALLFLTVRFAEMMEPTTSATLALPEKNSVQMASIASIVL